MAKTKTGTKTQEYTKEQLLHLYEEMFLQRRFEEKSSQMYMQQKIKGFCHLYIGQEAISSGIELAIRKDDYIITAYRDHGLGLSRGMSARSIMAEMYGKNTGSSKGKGGSMHIFSKEHNFLGGHGIVGGQIPLGAGIAFAIKYNKEDKLCICMMGDGAIRQGAFHEALNLAMLWKLPVIFMIENNQYAMGTSVERTSNVTELYKLGSAFEMPSWAIDAMDVFEVHREVAKAAKHVREGNGPVLLEMKTYRYKGHSMSDPMKYRTKEELEHYKGQDPVIRVKINILNNYPDSETMIEEIEKRVEDVVNDAVEFAENSPFPAPEELYQDVYKQEDYPYIME